MGLETKLPLDIFNNTNDLTELQVQLLNSGWRNVNFGFNLGRKSGATDIQKGNQRILIYSSTPADQQSFELLEQNDLPRFPLLMEKGKMTIVSIPIVARALDSMSFPDQEPKTGYLGSVEIMKGIADMLAKIFMKTSTIPDDLKLHKLALVTGETHVIRLIPPLHLQTTSNWHPLIDQLLEDLQNQDPINQHQTQIETFKKFFEECLKHD